MSTRASRHAGQLAAARIAADAASRDSNGTDAAQSLETLFPEPDLADLVPIVTGQHLWAARQSAATAETAGSISSPLVPFEDLPFPNSDRAKLAPCTIRWQFTGSFSLRREESIARGSLVVQVKRFLLFKGVPADGFLVNFPRGVGRGRFVDINVHHTSMAALADAPLVYRGARLQRHLVGPAVPKTAMVVEITGFSEADDLHLAARTAALFLQPFAKVHDIWLELWAHNDDPTPLPTNKLIVLVETAATASGGRDPAKIQAIPGWVNLAGRECMLDYVGRLDWCTTCRSSTTTFHVFDNCPRRRCYHCGKTGHKADRCPDATTGSEMAPPGDSRPAANADDLDYGQP